jgi:hypothetical protein
LWCSRRSRWTECIREPWFQQGCSNLRSNKTSQTATDTRYESNKWV